MTSTTPSLDIIELTEYYDLRHFELQCLRNPCTLDIIELTEYYDFTDNHMMRTESNFGYNRTHGVLRLISPPAQNTVPSGNFGYNRTHGVLRLLRIASCLRRYASLDIIELTEYYDDLYLISPWLSWTIFGYNRTHGVLRRSDTTARHSPAVQLWI